MSKCTYCNFQNISDGLSQTPLYKMCCEANMIKRCVEIVNINCDYLCRHDIEWLNLSEDDRMTQASHTSLAKKAYKCHYEMKHMLETCDETYWGYKNLGYCVMKVVNKCWYQDEEADTIYLNIQVLELQEGIHRLSVNTISTDNGYECYKDFTSAKKQLLRARKRKRLEQRARQIENDYTHSQRVQAANILISISQTPTERSLLDEFDAVAKSELVTKNKQIDATDCAICYNALGETNKIILRCGHQFCGDCIFRHHQCHNGSSCPSCRAQFI